MKVMNLREKTQLDNSALHDQGCDEHIRINDHVPKNRDKWSTASLYRLEVQAERRTKRGEVLPVNYVGWDEENDECRLKSEIVDLKEEHTKVQLLKTTLSVKIKENLNILCVKDTEATVHIPIQVETFHSFLTSIGSTEERRGECTIYRTSWTAAAEFLRAG